MMKKTSTRLATIGIVVMLGAFAIALAQHDSRHRERKPPETADLSSKPNIPIAVEGDWDARGGIVRANNDSLPADDLTQAEFPEGLTHEKGPGIDTAGATEGNPGNPLRMAMADLVDRGNALIDESSSVVLAAAQGPASPAPPGWMGDTNAQLPAGSPPPVAPALPRLPASNSSDNVGGSDLPALPTGSPSSGPSAAIPMGASQLPTFPLGAAVTATIEYPAANPSTAPISSPAKAATTAEFSDAPDDSYSNQTLVSDLPTLPSSAAGLPVATQTNSLSSQSRLYGDLPPNDLPGNANSLSSPDPSNTSTGSSANAFSQPMLPNADLGTHASAARSGAMPPSSQVAAKYTQDSEPPNSVGFGSAERDAQLVGIGGAPASGARTGARTPASLLSLVSNQPGNRYLDGSQNPIMMIQKRAPEEIQVGKRATFVIAVRNAGNATAHGVTIVDRVPQGARFESATPQVVPDAQGLLTWEIGEMAAGDERTISVQLIPEVEGELGSVASVQLAAQASVRTIATLARLEISTEASPEVLIAGAQSITVTIRNTGTGVARNVQLEADLPPQLQHVSGDAQMVAPIGDLRPHEVIQRTLTAAAVQPGIGTVAFRAVNEDGVLVSENLNIAVKAPQLTASIAGPDLRYLERQATYRVMITNNGTAAATDLEFTIRLPSGLKYISDSLPNFSEYDPNTHSLTVGMAELAPNTPAPIDVTVLPIELGAQVITFAARGALDVAAEAKKQVMVDGLAELAFTIGQDTGTIETGASSTYSVQVTNTGDKPDKNVQLLVQLPKGSELVNVNAQGIEYQHDGNQLQFAAIPEMRTNDQATFRFEVRHNQPGNHVVRSQLTSVNWPVAVVKEEGTLVYNDKN